MFKFAFLDEEPKDEASDQPSPPKPTGIPTHETSEQPAGAINLTGFDPTGLLQRADSSILESLPELGLKKCIAIKSSFESPFDVIKGKYEGGEKLWECSLDLCRWMISNESTNDPGARNIADMFRNKTVLELGCGHALPGILAMKACNASKIILQDYNHSVIREVTQINVAANIPSPNWSNVHLVYGPWKQLSSVLSSLGLENQIDMILAAETVYDQASTVDFCNCIFDVFAHRQNPGILIMATKRYYFGVGGGSLSFIETMQRLGNQRFDTSFETLLTIADGASNVREIWLVSVTPRTELMDLKT